MNDIREALGGTFDPNAEEPQTEFEVLPVAWYPMEVEKAGMVMTTNNDGQRIEIVFSVLGEQYANRKVWMNCNIVNKNPQAVAIAKKELAGLCLAVGLAGIDACDQLLGLRCQVKVKIETDKTGQYPPKNVPTLFKALDSPAVAPVAAAPVTAAPVVAAPAPATVTPELPATTAPAPAVTPAPAAAPATTGQPPWMRK